MDEMKQNASVATVIADVVGSRTSLDRGDLHRRLQDALTHLNQRLDPAAPLRITVGDEFQGAFDTVGQAIAAALEVRLTLAPEVDLRVGLGWGPIEVYAEDPRVEDGPGWWAARAGIEAVEAYEASPATRLIRTAYSLADEVDGPDPRPINAALLCRDQMIGALSDRSARLLSGLLAGEQQTTLAEREGISGSAVSQRVRGDGLAAIVAACTLLESIGLEESR